MHDAAHAAHLLAAAGTGPLVFDAIERRLPALGTAAIAAKPAAGDDAGQATFGRGPSCEVDVPEECDVDNQIVCRPDAE